MKVRLRLARGATVKKTWIERGKRGGYGYILRTFF